MRHDLTFPLLDAEQAHPALFRATLGRELFRRGALSVGFRQDGAALTLTVVWPQDLMGEPESTLHYVRRNDFSTALLRTVCQAYLAVDYTEDVQRWLRSNPTPIPVTVT